MHRRLWLFLSPLILMLSSCGSSNDGLSETDVAEIARLQEIFVDAELAGDWATAVTVFAEGAVRLIPNMPIVEGRPAILAQLESADTAIQTFSLSSSEVMGHGDLAVDRGSYVFAFTDPVSGALIEDRGKYVAVWRRRGGGDWRIVIDTYNSDLSAN